jgi:hypothetical protein
MAIRAIANRLGANQAPGDIVERAARKCRKKIGVEVLPKIIPQIAFYAIPNHKKAARRSKESTARCSSALKQPL